VLPKLRNRVGQRPGGEGNGMGSDEVRHSAARVQQIGDDIRRLAEQSRTTGEAEEVDRVRKSATALDEAAEALRRHAVAIELQPIGVGLGGDR
jgi:hypothetical protein